jgi:outer membrane biosynthesis protein TonB
MTVRSPGANSTAAMRSVTFILVALLHLGVVFGPLLLWDLLNRRTPKDNAFRVKIGGAELSKGPDVGMPERKLPTPPAPQPEPPKNPAPEPKVPEKIAEPKLPQKLPKPKPKPKPDPNAGVYTPPAASGGSITNPNVPTGGRNAAQTHADKFDNRTPGGGAKADMEKYGKNLTRFLKTKWSAPPDSLLASKRPKVLIELDIAADGRVLSKKIVTKSGIKSMDDSIDRMLQGLDRVPKPPKRTTLEIYLQMED